MNEKLPLTTVSTLIKLRNILHAVNQIGWSFSILNKQGGSVDLLTKEEAEYLIDQYQRLINEAKIELEKV